jgi:hypothetical protein
MWLTRVGAIRSAAETGDSDALSYNRRNVGQAAMLHRSSDRRGAEMQAMRKRLFLPATIARSRSRLRIGGAMPVPGLFCPVSSTSAIGALHSRVVRCFVEWVQNTEWRISRLYCAPRASLQMVALRSRPGHPPSRAFTSVPALPRQRLATRAGFISFRCHDLSCVVRNDWTPSCVLAHSDEANLLASNWLIPAVDSATLRLATYSR